MIRPDTKTGAKVGGAAREQGIDTSNPEAGPEGAKPGALG